MPSMNEASASGMKGQLGRDNLGGAFEHYSHVQQSTLAREAKLHSQVNWLQQLFCNVPAIQSRSERSHVQC